MFLDPPKKDTVFVPVGGYVVIRFKSNNIGYWFLHCHIEVHQAEGMSMIIQEGSHGDISELATSNKDDINLCEKGFDKSILNKANLNFNNNSLLVFILLTIFNVLI